MATNIQITDHVHAELEDVKDATDAQSFDAAIRELLHEYDTE